MQAKDLPDLDVLDAVDNYATRIGASVWNMNSLTGAPVYSNEEGRWPEKVLRAKLRSLRRRGLVEGCCCGCRGDFTLTGKGEALLTAHREVE